MRKKKLLCFDLDNTLVYSNEVHLCAFQKAFSHHGLPPRTRKQILRFFSLESSVLVRRLYPRLSSRKVREVVRDHNTFVIHETAKFARIIPGVLPALKRLKKKYILVILSNCTRREIFATLKRANIPRSLFAFVVGNDEVRHPKPAPDEVVKAEQMAHFRSGYMVGDSVYDIRAGKKAGLKTIAVLTGNSSRRELCKEKPDVILKSVAEISRLLL